jgi:hypothetical protein
MMHSLHNVYPRYSVASKIRLLGQIRCRRYCIQRLNHVRIHRLPHFLAITFTGHVSTSRVPQRLFLNSLHPPSQKANNQSLQSCDHHGRQNGPSTREPLSCSRHYPAVIPNTRQTAAKTIPSTRSNALQILWEL